MKQLEDDIGLLGRPVVGLCSCSCIHMEWLAGWSERWCWCWCISRTRIRLGFSGCRSDVTKNLLFPAEGRSWTVWRVSELYLHRCCCFEPSTCKTDRTRRVECAWFLNVCWHCLPVAYLLVIWH